MLRNKNRILWIALIALFIALGFFILENRCNVVWSNGNFSDVKTQVSSATTAIFIDTRVFCPVCQEKGLESCVYVGTSSTTLLYYQPWYDEDGVYHNENPNTITTYYSCSQGHEWYEMHNMGRTTFKITKDTEDEPEEYTLLEEGELSFYTDEEFLWEQDEIDYTPATTITFGNGVGTITWENGYMEFEGDAFESARIFFIAYLKPMIDGYIENKQKEGITITEEPDELLTIDEPEEVLVQLTTCGVLKDNFRPQLFLKVTDTDLSRCLIDDKLRIDLNGEIYWIKLQREWRYIPYMPKIGDAY